VENIIHRPSGLINEAVVFQLSLVHMTSHRIQLTQERVMNHVLCFPIEFLRFHISKKIQGYSTSQCHGISKKSLVLGISFDLIIELRRRTARTNNRWQPLLRTDVESGVSKLNQCKSKITIAARASRDSQR